MTDQGSEVLPGANRVERLTQAFKDEVVSASPEVGDLVVRVDRYVFPGTSDWCWSFTFESRAVCIEALWNGDDEVLVFEDESDYFEVNVPFDAVARHVVQALMRAIQE